MHFVVLSSEFSIDYNGPQYKYVENDLFGANATRSKWIVIFVHQPSYTSSTPHGVSKPFADYFHPLFHKYGVDLIINGHNHFYERTYPLIPGNNSLSPIIANNEDGQTYLSVGTGGEILEDFMNKPYFIASQYKGHGFLYVHIANNTLEGTFNANDGLFLMEK